MIKQVRCHKHILRHKVNPLAHRLWCIYTCTDDSTLFIKYIQVSANLAVVRPTAAVVRHHPKSWPHPLAFARLPWELRVETHPSVSKGELWSKGEVSNVENRAVGGRSLL
jgi:hypothetical protein